jgi:hypothetical protein
LLFTRIWGSSCAPCRACPSRSAGCCTGQTADRGSAILRDAAHLFGQPVLLPRHQQALGQDIGIDLALCPGSGEEHLAVFFKVHQPIGHCRFDVERLPGVAKRRKIFAVRVDHHDMAFGRHVADAVQDQRGGGRFAGAGRSQQREMLAQQRVDIEAGADIRVGNTVPTVTCARPSLA